MAQKFPFSTALPNFMAQKLKPYGQERGGGHGCLLIGARFWGPGVGVEDQKGVGVG